MTLDQLKSLNRKGRWFWGWGGCRDSDGGEAGEPVELGPSCRGQTDGEGPNGDDHGSGVCSRGWERDQEQS